MGDEVHWEKLTICRGGERIPLEIPIFPAPMAGALEPPYRMLLHDLGVELSFTEMVSARGVFEESKRTLEIAGWVPENGYSGAQIFGNDEQYISRAAEEMVRLGHHMIDLNAGCPKKKVMSQGSGGALLKDPDRLITLLSSILDSVEVPVGVKLRSGYNGFDGPSFRKLILEMEGLGLSYISIHGRTVTQGFRGSADREIIRVAASMVDIPIIASGDVKGLSDVLDYFSRGASGVMIGRALMGDPFLIRRIVASEDDSYPKGPSDIEGIFSMARKHLQYSLRFFGEKRGCVKFRTHLGWYVHSFPGRRPFMDRIHHISDVKDFIGLMEEIENEWKCQLDPC